MIKDNEELINTNSPKPENVEEDPKPKDEDD